MKRDVRGPVAALELLAGPAWTGIVAPRIRHLVELSQSFPRGTTGKPVGMDVPGRGSDQLDGDMGVSGRPRAYAERRRGDDGRVASTTARSIGG